jgi:hypothetical protein
MQLATAPHRHPRAPRLVPHRTPAVARRSSRISPPPPCLSHCAPAAASRRHPSQTRSPQVARVSFVSFVCPPPLHSKFLPSDAFHAPSIASSHPSSAVNRSVLVVRRETGAVPLHVELIRNSVRGATEATRERVHRSQPHRVLCRHLFYARHHAWRDPSVTSFRALLKTRTNSADQI